MKPSLLSSLRCLPLVACAALSPFVLPGAGELPRAFVSGEGWPALSLADFVNVNGDADTWTERDGVIVCRDGFRAVTWDEAGFRALVEPLGLAPRFVEVDGSSLFCELRLP